MAALAAPTKVSWNEIAKVGMPSREVRSQGLNNAPRTFLCRGSWSIFTSTMFADGSEFVEEDLDTVMAWAIIDGF